MTQFWREIRLQLGIRQVIEITCLKATEREGVRTSPTKSGPSNTVRSVPSDMDDRKRNYNRKALTMSQESILLLRGMTTFERVVEVSLEDFVYEDIKRLGIGRYCTTE